MQSWQADLLNLQLSLSVKQMFKYVGSVKRMRRMVQFSDRTFGRFAIPWDTERTPVVIDNAEFDAEWICIQEREAERVILYLPGGAYILRTPNIHAGMVSRLCKTAGAKALMVYYRLAPEHPFPACRDDAIEAYQWLLEQGVAAERIAIAGDSAGGGLTLSALLTIRDRNLPMPACAYMLSPLLDARDHAPSRWKNALSDTALPAPKRGSTGLRQLYLADNEIDNPLFSPINGDLDDLPPMYIQVSDSEMLLDDSLRLARRAHTYGVEVSVDIWRKVPHVWQCFSFLPEATEALEKASWFIKKQIV